MLAHIIYSLVIRFKTQAAIYCLGIQGLCFGLPYNRGTTSREGFGVDSRALGLYNMCYFSSTSNKSIIPSKPVEVNLISI